VNDASNTQTRWGLALSSLIALPLVIVSPGLLIKGWPWLTCVGAVACIAIACATRRAARTIPIVVLALQVFAIVSVVAASAGERVTSEAADGVIVDRDSYSEVTWAPGHEQIAALERDLPSYLRVEQAEWATHLLPHLKEFKRQYAGITSGLRPVIVVQFIHSDRAEKDAWLKWSHIHAVMGGGPHYWNVEYDPATRRFAQFWVNADQ
jgi:hypothetical protein